MGATKAQFVLHEAAQLQSPLKSSKPVLYTHTLCPYAQRVFLTMLLKAPLEFDVVHVDLSNKPRWYSRVNPRGLVPAVVHGNTTMLESLDICRQLEQIVPSPPLTPATPAARAQMEVLLDQTSGIVSAGLDLVAGTARHWGVGNRPSRAQQQRFDDACQHLAESLQRHGGPFLVGPQPCLADAALMPFLERFRLCLQLGQEVDFAKVQGGTIGAWLDAMSQLDACKLASPDAGLFSTALKQHSSLDFFDFVPYTACQLHPQLQES